MTFKKSTFVILLIAIITLSACEFDYTRTDEVAHQETYVPKFKTSESEFKDEVLRIIPAESINLSSSVSQKNGGKKTHSLTVNVLNPEKFSEPSAFIAQAEEVKAQAVKSIENLEQYEKIYILFEEKTLEKGLERTRTQKREIAL